MIIFIHFLKKNLLLVCYLNIKSSYSTVSFIGCKRITFSTIHLPFQMLLFDTIDLHSYAKLIWRGMTTISYHIKLL